MHKPDTQAPHHLPDLHLAQRWHRVRAAYRLANRASHHVLGFTVKLALALYFLFAIVFLMLRYAILPNIDYYKPDIERHASRALGSQVSIARIYASWQGLRPNLFLGDVILRDRQGRQVLSLPSVSATLSWWSLVAAKPRFDALEIIRPDLDVRRDAAGRVSVAGIVLDPKGGDGQGSDWLLSQREVSIRDGRIRWSDERRGAPQLTLEKVDLLMLNRWNHHRLALRATPPASLSGPLDLRADFSHPHFGVAMSDVRQWSGEMYADLRNTDVAAWKAYVNYPFEVIRGKGSVRAWLTLDRAKLASFTADLRLVDVAARLGKDLPPLELTRVQGRMSASETFANGANGGKPAFGTFGHTVMLSDFSLQTTGGLALAPTTIVEAYVPAKGAKPEEFYLSARQLDLETLARLAGQLPLSSPQRSMLADFAPRGQLSDFTASWKGRYPDISAYRIKGTLAGLAMRPQPARLAQARTASRAATAAVPAIPGFENLSGSIDASEKGGRVVLDSRALVLHLPAWFAEPSMPFDDMKLQARWSFAPQDQLLLHLESMHFVQGAIKGSLSGRHQMPLVAQPGKPAGVIDMAGTFDGVQLGQLGRLLPLATPPHLAAWLTTAIEDGVVNDATLRLRGDLARFPFREPGSGEFRVAGRMSGARLNYAPAQFGADGVSPQWPLAHDIEGTFAFERTRMQFEIDSARSLGVTLAKVKLAVPDLADPNRVLSIEGGASAPLQEFLRYIDASPVGTWTGRFTEQVRATGPARLALKMQLPLTHMKDSRVQGALQLMNNEVMLFPDLPPLHAAIGKLDFTERGVTLSGMGASFLGGPLALTGGSSREGGVQIRLSGAVSAEGIARQYPGAAMAPVASRISGGARYTGAITVRDGLPQVVIDSTLAGLGLAFPAPLNKAAAEALPLHFALTGLQGSGAGTAEPVARDEIRINLGSTMAARYLRQRVGKGAWRVTSGGLGVNAPAPEPEEGLTINANMKLLNVDQWLELGSRVSAAAGPRAEGAGGGANMAQYVVPDVMAARASELIILDRKLDTVVVGASHQARTWQASIDSRQVSGHVTWNEGPAGQGLGKVTARLASLIIPESSKAGVKDLLESSKSPASSIPALDIVAERFELFNKQLGRLELAANNVQAAGGREWRINRLLLANPDGVLTSTGKWALRDGVSSTGLNFSMEIEDAGRMLERFGFPDTLKRGKGKMTGDIAWNGLPYSLDIPSLSGKIELKLASGQFLKKDPGAAKLLGVLSLQMLPRILKLDFHDVFSEGLAFDGISANAAITRGVLRTDNLRMWGVAATVLMDGSVDIANETANLHVVVIPEFNLGTGPLVYALAVNPVVGVGSFLAQLFLREPVMRALTYEMQVTGPWKTPVVTKLAGKGRPAPVKPKEASVP
ncbi:TIGR02099 family protein [Massilia sp. PAMC28688]|uniref:YhdP family protein n=1 Tax=Massilia sp. PAMC28688 TaxID=2861283 RepID=UPI001C6342B5|nr:YhdP family protein [Massilia sp. PAMC28688]QYF94242.1 TIGR02099 family protein [Massilia sp. PAMC28688]